MVGIYALITIFTQFWAPIALPITASLPSISDDSSAISSDEIPSDYTLSAVELAVQNLGGVQIGSPVVLSGDVIGSVSEIRKPRSQSGTFRITLKLEDLGERDLRDGAIGIITSPISRLNVAPTTVVELVNPRDADQRDRLRDGCRLPGFSSLSEFWASPSRLSVL